MELDDFELQFPDPKLRDPHAIAVHAQWLNGGYVGDVVFDRLISGLGATSLGALRTPGRFYDFTINRPTLYTDGTGGRKIEIPTSVVYHVRREPHDLVLLYLLEPNHLWESYEEGVIDLVEKLGVTRYVVVGGIEDRVPHTRPIVVTGESGDAQLSERFGEMKVRAVIDRDPGASPTSELSLIPQELQNRGTTTASLIAHVPYYLRFESGDSTCASKLIRILMGLENIEFPQEALESLEDSGRQQYNRLNQGILGDLGLISDVRRLERAYDQRFRP